MVFVGKELRRKTQANWGPNDKTIKPSIIYWYSLYNKAAMPALLTALTDKYQVKYQPPSLLSPLYCRQSEEFPLCVIVEFEQPNLSIFRCVYKLMKWHPALPIVLVLPECSQRFLLWAIRHGIWDVCSPSINGAINGLITRINKMAEPDETKLRPLFSVKAESVQLMPQEHVEQQRLEPALFIIEREFSRKITEYELAKSCLLSVHHFSRLFKKTLGIVLQEYIVQRRLQEAHRLLSDSPQLQIAVIAYSVGFKDPSYFGRVFKRIYNMSPCAYRDSLKIKQIRSGEYR